MRNALEDGFVSKLIFGIAADKECRDIYEEVSFYLFDTFYWTSRMYKRAPQMISCASVVDCLLLCPIVNFSFFKTQYVFYFEYDLDGNILVAKLDLGNGPKRLTKPDANLARQQVVRLLRSLVSITRTLDPVPDQRTIFCKMEFVENCPETYQPVGFEDAGDRAIGYFRTEPMAMRLGTVTTPFHNMRLGVRSILDTVDVVPGRDPLPDTVSRWTTADQNGEPPGSLNNNNNNLNNDARANGDGNTPRGGSYYDGVFTESQDVNALAVLEAVIADADPGDVLRKQHLMKLFPNICASKITTALDALVAQGVLRLAEADVNEPSSFVVSGVKNSKPGHSAEPISLGGVKSRVGGIHSVPGSVCTQSIAQAGQICSAPADDEEVGQLRDLDSVPVDNAQRTTSSQSVFGRQKRKWSIVEHPIHQDGDGGNGSGKRVRGRGPPKRCS